MCQRNDPDLGKLWGSGKERDTLVGNMKSIWDVEKEKDNINCDHHSFIRYNNGSPDFKITFEHHSAVFHHRCTGKYSKQKVDRLKKQQKENKERAVFTRSSSSSKPVGSPFCAICDKEDDEGNLPAAGTQGATKNALDTQYNAKLTKWWKDMAIKTNNDSFLAKLATGTLASNEIFYHLNCYSSMSRNYQRIIEGKDEHQKKNIGLKLRVLNPSSPLLSRKKKARRAYLLQYQNLTKCIYTCFKNTVSARPLTPLDLLQN